MKREELIASGIDYDDGVKRFLGRESMYFSFLKRFPDDKTCFTLDECIKKHDYDEAFKAAHMLKGTCGNLALKELYEVTCVMVEKLRNHIYDDVDTDMENIRCIYNCVIATINKI